MAGGARRRRTPPRRRRARVRRRRLGRASPCPAIGARSPRSPTPTARSSTGRTSSSTRTRQPGTRRWVTFDGVFYQADVWLDGAYLGDPEGYFFPHGYDISVARSGSARTRARGRGVAARRSATRRRSATSPACSSTGTACDPDWNPGGLWRPVRIETTGPVRIDTLRVLVPRRQRRARPPAPSRLGSTATRPSRCACARSSTASSWRRRSARSRADRTQSTGTSTSTTRDLWWPWSLGDQPLTDVTRRGHRRRRAQRHAATSARGCGRSRCSDWMMSVNGERLFLKGANLGPTRLALAEATPRRAPPRRRARPRCRTRPAPRARPRQPAGAVRRRRRAGHADLAGLPAAMGVRPIRAARRRCARPARRSTLLGHHPSIAMWCGHNEPLTLPSSPASRSTCAV